MSETHAPRIHTRLTIADVDTINGCRLRALSGVVLLELGMTHIDDYDDLKSDPESIRLALLDVIERLREDLEAIGRVVDVAGARVASCSSDVAPTPDDSSERTPARPSLVDEHDNPSASRP